MQTKKVTIDDIALLSNVSKTTVSRYINGKFQYMSTETMERIRHAIDITGYCPNNIARSLKNNRSMIIGLVVADIESPFSSAFIKSVGNAINDSAYHMIIVNSDNRYTNEESCIRSLISQQVDGLIVNTTSAFNPFLIDLANNGFPIVLMDRIVRDYAFDTVMLDTWESVHKTVDHLNEMGFSAVSMFIQSPYDNISPRFLRRDAFLEKLSADGVRDPQSWVYEVGSNDPQTIKNAIIDLIRRCKGHSAPSAIITTNGVTLFITSQIIGEMKLSMPHEIGLCGYYEWGWFSEIGWPEFMGNGRGLTTLEPSVLQLGETAAKILLRRIGGETFPKSNIIIPAPLCIRHSTDLKGAILKKDG